MTTPDVAALASSLPVRIAARTGEAVYAIVVLLLTSIGVGAAARRGILIPVAVPFAAVLVIALRVLRPPAERAAWALFTVWLGTTYLQTGAMSETAMALIYLAAALAGVFVSPWLLVAAWAAHPLWDLLPRTLPAVLNDLPTACLFFDLAIAAYLAWVAVRGGWSRGAAVR